MRCLAESYELWGSLQSPDDQARSRELEHILRSLCLLCTQGTPGWGSAGTGPSEDLESVTGHGSSGGGGAPDPEMQRLLRNAGAYSAVRCVLDDIPCLR